VAELRTIPVDQIDYSPHNPRRVFDDESLHALADSITRLGVLQPILVRWMTERERYEIVAGERRWRASCLAERPNIPALVIELDDPTRREIQLVENLEREQLNPIDEAQAFEVLQQHFNYTDTGLAQRLKRSSQFVRGRLDLLKLDPRVQQLVAQGRITIGSALELVRLDDGDVQLGVAQQVVQDNLTALATAARVNHHKFEQRLLATQASRRLSLERKTEALAERGIVITTHTFDPERHHRVWDLVFNRCDDCQLKGTFLRDDGQVEAICVEPACYNDLLTTHRAFRQQAERLQGAERRRELERVLDVDDVTTPHLCYLLWTLLNAIGPEADTWRAEFDLPDYVDASAATSAEWDTISSWSDEQLLTSIMRLCIGHIATLSNNRLPEGLKHSLIEQFGVNPHVLSQRVASNETR